MRLPIAVMAVASLLIAGVLLLSDRAPVVLEAVFGRRAREWSRRLDRRSGLELDPGRTIPDVDVIVHVVIWAGVTLLLGLAIWSWRGLALSVATTAALSVLAELAQERWSTTRAIEPGDVAANVSGIAIGALAAAVCYGCWSAIASARRRRRART